MDNLNQRVLRRLAVAVVLACGILATAPFQSSAPAAETGQPGTKSDLQRLVGRWVRPDGGYILELKDIGKDGSLKAAYFNPRPINVAKVELKKKDRVIILFVELRDINYPGSTYTLRYDPKGDRLAGEYFQAMQQQTFDVEFQRLK